MDASGFAAHLSAMFTDRESADPRHAWLSLLIHELFQTEQSAYDHPRVEADRLGDAPPAEILRAVAEHAKLALAELPPLVKRHDLPDSIGGKAVGAAFSTVRDYLADVMLSAEKSYRATLLGMRHGVDLVELIATVAREDGDEELATWCGRWLGHRRPLVEAAARELAWFASHPEHATEAARRDSAFALGLHAFIRGCQRIAQRLRQAQAPAHVDPLTPASETP